MIFVSNTKTTAPNEYKTSLQEKYPLHLRNYGKPAGTLFIGKR